MITGISISNFKAIGETVTIPVRPITLLFGANSSGKSSVLQCLRLLKQFSEEKKYPKENEIDVGDFRDFIHQHDIKKDLCVKFTCKLDEYTVINSLAGYHYFHDLSLAEYYGEKNLGNIARCFQKSLEGYAEYGIAYYLGIKEDIASWYRIELFIGDEDQPVLSHVTESSTNDILYTDYNYDHSYWLKFFDIFQDYIIQVCKNFPESILRIVAPRVSEKTKSIIVSLLAKFNKNNDPNYLVKATLSGKMEILRVSKTKKAKEKEQNAESFKKMFIGQTDPKKIFLKLYEYHQASSDAFLHGNTFFPNQIAGHDLGDLLRTDYEDFKEDVTHYDISNPLLLIPILSQQIKHFLSSLDYIGPLRETPERYYLPGHKGDNGARALCEDSVLLQRVNQEFFNLQAGYQLEIVKLTNPDVNVDGVFLLQFIDQRNKTRATIKDVGFGFSQVLPIIVKSRAESYKQILIEQPELHLHPAMQAELGDLFIRGALGAEIITHELGNEKVSHTDEKHNIFILETHSEHLILRLLRRIRETTDNELPDNVPPIKPDDIAVLYVQSGEKGAEVVHIPITIDGEFTRPWPQGFFPERARELF